MRTTKRKTPFVICKLFGFVAGLVLVCGDLSPAGAALVNEIEPNDSIAGAQNIDGNFTLDFDENIGDTTTNTSTTIPHVTIAGTGDGTNDHYSFSVNAAGTRAIFDIDFGTTGNHMDAWLDLLDSNGVILATNDDASSDFGQGGSVSGLDSYLEFTFTSPGVYVIRVGEFPDGRPIDSGADYQLQVSIEQSFDTFTIGKTEIKFDDHPSKESFKVHGAFSTSDGIDPLTEEVTVRVGTVMVNIPAGSFGGSFPKFEFKGTIDGVDVKMVIEETDIINTFKFKVKAKGVDLTNTANPLDIGLQIGGEKGSATIRLEGKLRFKAKDDDNDGDRDGERDGERDRDNKDHDDEEDD